MATILGGISTLHGALRAAERSWLRHLDAALCARRLTADQWCMLTNLSSDSGITMSELAARAQLPPSSATRHADHLAERGLIFRVAAADDRRRILIGLSRRGVELVGEVRAEEMRAEGELRRRLGGGDYRELLRLLERVSDAPFPQ
ncbi:MarR family transcriptional regulator [Nocardia sp. SYP-A9097]|uniref:MarR family winged helix-turn-helix transcriptional regulator n=1 Tax=Nocardia sp. SYP-A9097 TaxID=2663237 RepID=UPI00129BBE9E|nr:MarR family transcriptional regulator [Nocardia sp. SYP-A9097]MRH92478.1 MarR family transcriptional regulator [Nocardia sp. SYP-A9097]